MGAADGGTHCDHTGALTQALAAANSSATEEPGPVRARAERRNRVHLRTWASWLANASPATRHHSRTALSQFLRADPAGEQYAEACRSRRRLEAAGGVLGAYTPAENTPGLLRADQPGPLRLLRGPDRH